MRISDWSSDVCSSDLLARLAVDLEIGQLHIHGRVVIPAFSRVELTVPFVLAGLGVESDDRREEKIVTLSSTSDLVIPRRAISSAEIDGRSEEHTSDLQSLMRISYAVFCLKKINANKTKTTQYQYMTILH